MFSVINLAAAFLSLLNLNSVNSALVIQLSSCRSPLNERPIASSPRRQPTRPKSCLFVEKDDETKTGEEDLSRISKIDENEGVMLQSDDSGRKHDMTDRFKYKVNALMGTYDPANGKDDEYETGNILNAMLNFPLRYTFNVVGKTDGNDTTRQEYVEQVKHVVLETSGDNEATWEILPRGSKFTKVQCEVEVQSATMINTIYKDISNLERTVMRF